MEESYGSYNASSLMRLDLCTATYRINDGSLEGMIFTSFNFTNMNFPSVDDYVIEDQNMFWVLDAYNGWISATVTFSDGSWMMFDAEQNSDVYYFDIHDVSGDDLSIAKLILPAVENLERWSEMDEFVTWACGE